MNSFEQELQRRLEEIEKNHLRRNLRRCETAQGPQIVLDGNTLLNFSSNDYLGLASHPAIKQAAIHAVERYGTGSGASRLICGSLTPHHALEETLATWKGAEAALSFSSGYATALGAICALVGREDIIILDKLVHASIVDAARLSGATLRVFRHNDLSDLESILQWTVNERGQGNVLVVTESVFSMDGDLAPLQELVALKNSHSAWLLVDEAHACGLFGKRLSGRVESEGLQGQVEVQMGTLGKALGSSGGFIAGPRILIDYLVNKARSFIFSTAPAPSVSAAAEAAVQMLLRQEGADLAARLWANVEQFGIQMETPAQPPSPIVPVMIGQEEQALALANELREAGIFVPAIRYPTVARGKARLRVSLSASHTEEDVRRLTEALRSLKLGQPSC